MSNYGELVKALRFETDYVAVEKTMRDAADAIEALQAEVERLQVDLEAAYALMEVQDGQ